MNLKLRKVSLGILAIAFLILIVGPQSYAHRRGESVHYSGRGAEQRAGQEGGAAEGSGVIAAWLFGIANFPVALSVIPKTSGKAALPQSSLKITIEKANRRQKRLFMKLHYWMNPVAASVAIFHFSRAECRSTFMPELGMWIMILILILGLMMTFKLSPASMRKAIFKFHTSPVSLLIAISILLIGHSIVN
jgi:hypothetical protein